MRIDAAFPIGVMTAVTGVSGSGKSTLVSQALVELVAERLGQNVAAEEEENESLEDRPVVTVSGRITDGMQHIRRLVVRGPETDRPHSAIKHGDVHGTFRSRAPFVCGDKAGARTPVRRRAILIQCCQRPL